VTVERARSGFQLQTMLMRSWRAVGRLRDPEDVELADDLRELARVTDSVLDDAPARDHWPRPSVTAMSDLLWSALRALSAVAAAQPTGELSPEALATRVTLTELAFEICAALWSLGTRPEMICLRCSLSYKPTGLLGCPRGCGA